MATQRSLNAGFSAFDAKPAKTSVPCIGGNNYLKDVQAYFETTEDRDCQVLVENKTISVHSELLKMRSPVFRAMLSGYNQEAITGIIHITDFSETSITRAIAYIYTDTCEAGSFKQILELMLVANKYDISGLQKLCEDYIIGNHLTEQEQIVQVWDVAFKYNLTRIQKHMIKKIAR